MKKEKYTCACCGYKTLDEGPGNYEICPICFWENDPVQENESLHVTKEDALAGANNVSLREAQKNFIKFGVCTKRRKLYVRKPTSKDIKDPNWKPLE